MDANQFVADEDDATYSCRVSGVLLLEEVVNSCGSEGIHAIIDAMRKRFNESQQEKASGSEAWWRVSEGLTALVIAALSSWCALPSVSPVKFLEGVSVIREAILFAFAALSDQLLEAEVFLLTSLIVVLCKQWWEAAFLFVKNASGLISVNLANLVEQMVTEDIGTRVHEYPFLYARIFTSVAKFSSVISPGVLEHFLHAAILGVGMNVPPPVKVGACQALSQLLPEANNEIIQPQLMGLFSSLTDLLHQASDETLHLVLETLQASIKAGREVAVSFESVVSPAVLNIWALHVSDPFLSIDAIEVLENRSSRLLEADVVRIGVQGLLVMWSELRAVVLGDGNGLQGRDDVAALAISHGDYGGLRGKTIVMVGVAMKNAPGGIHPLVSRILPHIGPILNKNAPRDVIKAMYDTCFDAVIRIVLQSDDHSEMQNATQCLASFISGGREEILSWAADSGFTMRSLLDAASSNFYQLFKFGRLLNPDLESSGSLFVGSYVLQLILHLPLQMATHIRDLVAALVRRMQSAQIVGLKSSLLLIFARLVHMSAPHVEQFIDMLIGVPAEGYENSFVYVMSEWTNQQGEIQGAYQIKVTTSALALLLSTRRSELSKINVQGHLKSAAGITTRSKAKLAPDQWTIVPLPVKILALLADTVIEFQEQAIADDEESDWEEIQGGVAESNDNLLHSVAAPSFGRTTYGQLEAMAKAYNENEEDGDDDDQLSVSDPLNEGLAQNRRDAIQTLVGR
ncbi:unnamed protein product [Dovyalis caffra]|uniref:Importin-9 n=1 Tax=Dovyalis caffra TaxID=77055 RepID=A0AAV1QXG4_9ROSI|nr:unnamed protein product [Dovyalis caffra]